MISDITPPSPAPAGILRAATVSFRNLRAATTARNTIHSAKVPSSTSGQSITTLRTSYHQPIAAHAVRDYIAGHPKLFLPVLFFLIGTVTYTVCSYTSLTFVLMMQAFQRYSTRFASLWLRARWKIGLTSRVCLFGKYSGLCSLYSHATITQSLLSTNGYERIPSTDSHSLPIRKGHH